MPLLLGRSADPDSDPDPDPDSRTGTDTELRWIAIETRAGHFPI